MPPVIKICCIASLEEAQLAIAAGASALGLVSAMPSGPGVIDETRIASIAAAVPASVATFLLTSRQDAESIIRQHLRCQTTTLQLVDRVPPAELALLRQELPGVRLVQVIHVSGQASVDEARSAAPLVDALLLDSGNQNLAVKELGGTGRTHDWRFSREICASVGKPVYLAGGLTPANVAAAIARVQPYGVDLCTGVRTAGRLDPVRLKQFVTAVRSA